jgi:hypothetical protein
LTFSAVMFCGDARERLPASRHYPPFMASLVLLAHTHQKN